MIKYEEEIKSMNLWEKISQISSEIEYLKKDDVVGTGNNSYKAISIEKVMDAVGQKMAKYGVVIYPIKQDYTRKDEVTQGIDFKTKLVVDKLNRISEVDVIYEVVNIHNPIEKINPVSSGTGVDTQDKGVGKAMTYAYKNMIIKLFAIPTGDDTDKVHSDDYTKNLTGDIEILPTITVEMEANLYAMANRVGVTPNDVIKVIKGSYKKTNLKSLTKEEYQSVYERLEKKLK